MLFLLLGIDIFGSMLGIFTTSASRVRSRVMAVSGGILFGVALVWMLPEMGQISGWHYAGIALGGGLGVLLLVDRFVFPVCPCCTHAHHGHSDQLSAVSSQRSFEPGISASLLVPVVTGICLHNFLDGWSTQLATATAGNLGIGMLVGNLVHKAPESIVLGLLLQSATRRPINAAGLAAFASVFLPIGGAVQTYSASFQSPGLFMASLTFAGAGFLFVGVHMFRSECARNGRRAATWSLATGFAAVAVVERAVALLAAA